MARLVLAGEARYRAHDETDAIVIEQSGLSLDRLQGTRCHSAPDHVLDDRQGKHAVIFDSTKAIGNGPRIPSASIPRCAIAEAALAERAGCASRTERRSVGPRVG